MVELEHDSRSKIPSGNSARIAPSKCPRNPNPDFIRAVFGVCKIWPLCRPYLTILASTLRGTISHSWFSQVSSNLSSYQAQTTDIVWNSLVHEKSWKVEALYHAICR